MCPVKSVTHVPGCTVVATCAEGRNPSSSIWRGPSRVPSDACRSRVSSPLRNLLPASRRSARGIRAGDPRSGSRFRRSSDWPRKHCQDRRPQGRTGRDEGSHRCPLPCRPSDASSCRDVPRCRCGCPFRPATPASSSCDRRCRSRLRRRDTLAASRVSVRRNGTPQFDVTVA